MLPLYSKKPAEVEVKLAKLKRVFSSSTKEKMRVAANNRPPVSEATKEKQRQFHLGRKHTPEAKQRIGASSKGWVRGPMSNQHKARISESLKGIPHSAEHNRKVSDGLRGKPKSKLHKAKMSLTMCRFIREGRIKTTPQGVCGVFLSIKNNKIIRHRSLLERRWYEKLEADPNVLWYKIEPHTIAYEWEGQTRHYIPDLKVKYVNGCKVLIEIKPENRRDHPRSIAKWDAARKWVNQKGFQFIVVGYDEL